jgi:hypothetical protein
VVNPNLAPINDPNVKAPIRRRGAALRRLLNEAIERSGKNRDEIAEQMGKALDSTFTRSMLNEFTRNGDLDREARFPATLVSAFCEATGCDELARFVMGERLRELVELGERLCTLDSILGQMQAALGKLKGQRGHRSKSKGKRPRKA